MLDLRVNDLTLQMLQEPCLHGVVLAHDGGGQADYGHTTRNLVQSVHQHIVSFINNQHIVVANFKLITYCMQDDWLAEDHLQDFIHGLVILHALGRREQYVDGLHLGQPAPQCSSYTSSNPRLSCPRWGL